MRMDKAQFGQIEIDTEAIQAFKNAGIDDYSLVYVANYGVAQNPDWDPSFVPIPAGDPATRNRYRAEYLQKLTEAMHDPSINLQVVAGYNMGDFSASVSGFMRFMSEADGSQVAAHAQAIIDFYRNQQITVDGVCFDIEIASFAPGNPTFNYDNAVANYATLLVETAKAMAAWRGDLGFVAYANGACRPHDGEGVPAFGQFQKYALARGAPNLIAQPQCYGARSRDDHAVFAHPTGVIADSIKCALSSDPLDGGLDPSQLQMGIDLVDPRDEFGTSLEYARYICETYLRPNGVGMVYYNIGKPGDHGIVFDNAKALNDALNPGAPGPGTSGQPAQRPLP
jgi:hypothetical protein